MSDRVDAAPKRGQSSGARVTYRTLVNALVFSCIMWQGRRGTTGYDQYCGKQNLHACVVNIEQCYSNIVPDQKKLSHLSGVMLVPYFLAAFGRSQAGRWGPAAGGLHTLTIWVYSPGPGRRNDCLSYHTTGSSPFVEGGSRDTKARKTPPRQARLFDLGPMFVLRNPRRVASSIKRSPAGPIDPWWLGALVPRHCR